LRDRPEKIAEQVFDAKRQRRALMSRLTFEEKIQILVRLQVMASEIVASTGRVARTPWRVKPPQG